MNTKSQYVCPKDFLTVAPPTSHHASKLSHDEEQLLAKLEEQNRCLHFHLTPTYLHPMKSTSYLK
uniref:Uncharacterized protein n=1 Tax=Electrophorus electricus TaxID=8005 RepID=A0A4W4FFV4_ELEEL